MLKSSPKWALQGDTGEEQPYLRAIYGLYNELQLGSPWRQDVLGVRGEEKSVRIAREVLLAMHKALQLLKAVSITLRQASMESERGSFVGYCPLQEPCFRSRVVWRGVGASTCFTTEKLGL